MVSMFPPSSRASVQESSTASSCVTQDRPWMEPGCFGDRRTFSVMCVIMASRISRSMHSLAIDVKLTGRYCSSLGCDVCLSCRSESRWLLSMTGVTGLHVTKLSRFVG